MVKEVKNPKTPKKKDIESKQHQGSVLKTNALTV